MCGICGFVGSRKEKKAIIGAMMEAIEHRGPDSYGAYYSQEASLGFRRLSIIDLKDGNQPMRSEDDRWSIVFNGEIYNYRELRKEFEKSGLSFRTSSDTEVLLKGIQLYGEKILNRLRGMFGFAVWDKEEKTLMLARDFFGIKPVYFAEIGGCLVFASEIKSILQFPGYVKKVNERALEQYLSFQYSVLEETFFEGIFKLLPGHVLFYKDGKIKIRPYFVPKLKPQKGAKEQELLERLDGQLRHTVKRHMVSDVEVGSFLSGGVDSGFLTSVSRVDKAFTVGFGEGKKYSEVSRAKRITDNVSLEHHIKIISKREFWDALPNVMYHMDEPSGDASAVALYFLAKEASKHVKVVLSGEGADELFGGYNIYREPEALKGMAWLPGFLRRLLGRFAEKLPDVKGRDYLIRAGKSVEERFIGNACIFKENEKRDVLLRPLTGPSAAGLLSDSYQKVSHLKDMEKMQYIDLNYWLPGDILQKADKMSMAHSLEVRVPFLDKDVYDLASRFPKKLKIKEHTTKYLFRKAISKYLPQDASGTKKLGFPVPIRVWMREKDWYEQIKDRFTSKTAKQFFQTDKLLGLLEEHREEKKDNSRKIWTVLMFLIWYEVYFEDSAEKCAV